MRFLRIASILLPVLFTAPSAFGWTGQWNNLYPFGGYQCAPIPPGSLVQLIHAGPNGVPDDPVSTLSMSELIAWMAAGRPPVGDDTLRDETVFLDYGPGYEGYFGKAISGNDSEQGDPWYTRFFGHPKYEVTFNQYYGEVGDPENPDDPIYELVLTGWNGASYDFGDYKIRLEGVCAELHIVAEPSTLAVAAVAMLLGFARGRRRGSSV